MDAQRGADAGAVWEGGDLRPDGPRNRDQRLAGVQGSHLPGGAGLGGLRKRGVRTGVALFADATWGVADGGPALDESANGAPGRRNEDAWGAGHKGPGVAGRDRAAAGRRDVR